MVLLWVRVGWGVVVVASCDRSCLGDRHALCTRLFLLLCCCCRLTGGVVGVVAVVVVFVVVPVTVVVVVVTLFIVVVCRRCFCCRLVVGWISWHISVPDFLDSRIFVLVSCVDRWYRGVMHFVFVRVDGRCFGRDCCSGGSSPGMFSIQPFYTESFPVGPVLGDFDNLVIGHRSFSPGTMILSWVRPHRWSTVFTSLLYLLTFSWCGSAIHLILRDRMSHARLYLRALDHFHVIGFFLWTDLHCRYIALTPLILDRVYSSRFHASLDHKYSNTSINKRNNKKIHKYFC